MLQTICWNCKWSTNPDANECIWSASLEPVPGWKAKLAKRKIRYSGKTKVENYYTVVKCPLYKEG